MGPPESFSYSDNHCRLVLLSYWRPPENLTACEIQSGTIPVLAGEVSSERFNGHLRKYVNQQSVSE